MSEATIATPQGQFTADTAGPPDGELVLLLHGYPQSRHAWRHQVPALGRAGYRAVAPDQRGYSPGVRPDPARGLDAYGIDRLVQDVLDLADAAGPPGRPFHLVGHDWGGHVSWVTAYRHPARLRSLTVLSRPHPGRLPEGIQGERRRPAAPLAPPRDLPRPDHRPPPAGGRGPPAPEPARRAGRLPRLHRRFRDRPVPLRDPAGRGALRDRRGPRGGHPPAALPPGCPPALPPGCPPALPPGCPRMISSLRSGAAPRGRRQRRIPSWRKS